MSETYADRPGATHTDGTRTFATVEDIENERAVRRAFEEAWQCSVRPFGALCQIDAYVEKHGRLVAIFESKSRTHASDKYPTVFLNVRKWIALTLASHGLGVPAIFAVAFTDEIRWIRLTQVDARATRIGGCAAIVKSSSDTEPVIEISVTHMQRL